MHSDLGIRITWLGGRGWKDALFDGAERVVQNAPQHNRYSAGNVALNQGTEPLIEQSFLRSVAR
jgi:hypothetical protein